MNDGTYAAPELSTVVTALDWLNENIGDEQPAWQWMSAVDVTDPETDRLLGQAHWHGDGYWRFRPAIFLGGAS